MQTKILFRVSPQVVRTPKQSNLSSLTENCLEEVMTSGSELEYTDWSTSQNKEGCGSFYKKIAKVREREKKNSKNYN